MRTLIFGLLFCLSLGANATAMLVIDGSGQLRGATGVVVGDTLFDVEFVEGVCIGLFGACGESTSFTFTDPADPTNGALANAANDALLAQVFLDVPGGGQFDSQPELTFGCPPATPSRCNVLTPFNVMGSLLSVSRLSNTSAIIDEGSNLFALFPNRTTVDGEQGAVGESVYARWTATGPVSPVPVPAALPLFLTALGGFGVMRRRRLKV